MTSSSESSNFSSCCHVCACFVKRVFVCDCDCDCEVKVISHCRFLLRQVGSLAILRNASFHLSYSDQIFPDPQCTLFFLFRVAHQFFAASFDALAAEDEAFDRSVWKPPTPSLLRWHHIASSLWCSGASGRSLVEIVATCPLRAKIAMPASSYYLLCLWEKLEGSSFCSASSPVSSPPPFRFRRSVPGS